MEYMSYIWGISRDELIKSAKEILHLYGAHCINHIVDIIYRDKKPIYTSQEFHILLWHAQIATQGVTGTFGASKL